ncbi:MAG TPA: penicillin-binding protein 2 [Levilinea sp.]|nr:penicillin-binding protein 2 [Levilinea sp.]
MNDRIFSRAGLVGLVLSLLGGLILFQMARIQASPGGQQLKVIGRETYEFTKVWIEPERGKIYDRWGSLLAGNREVYEVGLNLIDVRNPETIAKDLSEVLDLPHSEILAKARTPYDKEKAVYLVIDSFVSQEKIAELEKRRTEYSNLQLDRRQTRDQDYIPPSLRGVTWRPHLQRVYPEKTLASNVLGFYAFMSKTGAKPYFGIEQQYNELLSGTPVEAVYYFDPNKAAKFPDVPPGASLLLTIDREIQVTVEQILDDAVVANGAESGTIIVADPRTGEILAMATTPRMDLNEYWILDEIFPNPIPFNRAIGQSYEPGSVFKVITFAAALDSDTITPDQTFLDTGVFNYGGHNIYNWDRGAWGPQSMLGCMQHSLNVCLAWMAVEMGPATFYEYLHAFGISRRTNIDLGGEVKFPLPLPGDSYWADINLATNSFGQGLSTTPIQMVAAISAIANDGKMMAPHVLKAVIADGHQRDVTPTVVSQPISAETARMVTEMLAVSLETEASSALVPGYRVAGKTGTGEIPAPGGYLIDKTNASFVGWGPVDDPRFIVYVWLEKPTSSIWGSVVAAPVFSEVVRNITVLMNLPPDDVRQQLFSSQ